MSDGTTELLSSSFVQSGSNSVVAENSSRTDLDPTSHNHDQHDEEEMRKMLNFIAYDDGKAIPFIALSILSTTIQADQQVQGDEETKNLILTKINMALGNQQPFVPKIEERIWLAQYVFHKRVFLEDQNPSQIWTLLGTLKNEWKREFRDRYICSRRPDIWLRKEPSNGQAPLDRAENNPCSVVVQLLKSKSSLEEKTNLCIHLVPYGSPIIDAFANKYD